MTERMDRHAEAAGQETGEVHSRTVDPSVDDLDRLSPGPEAGRPVDWKPAARITGWLFVLFFCGLAETVDGFRIQNYPPFSAISQGELMLWIGTALLLVPGSVLLGVGYADAIAPVLRALARRVDGLAAGRRRALAIVAFVAFAGAAWAGNTLIVGGYPVTDDEYAVRFGGQLLASGRLVVPEPSFVDAIPTLFYFRSGGLMSSMDWLGPQIIWAVSEITHTGNLVWAVLASVAFIGVAVACGLRLGARWGLAAAAMFAASPMASALSMSTHAHLGSRAFFSVALVFLADGMSGRRSRRAWFLFGLAIGASFLCRPFETAFLGVPIGLDLAWRAVRRDGSALEELGAVLAGLALPLAIFGLHSWAITGNPIIPPRFVPGAAVPAELPVSSTWGRFGNGVAFNALMLAVWFLGPLGIALATIGAWADRLTRLLAAGIGSVLALGLLHDNFGIHTVGPIHYSECVVPLTYLATHGLFVAARWLKTRAIDFAPVACAVAVILVVAMGAFQVVTSIGLRRHADIQAGIYGRIESLVPGGASGAIVLAPSFASIWKRDETFTATGSWVFVWRRPRPDYSDPVMILYDVPGIESRLQRAFPDRRLYRLVPGKTGTDFEVLPVAAAPQSAGP